MDIYTSTFFTLNKKINSLPADIRFICSSKIHFSVILSQTSSCSNNYRLTKSGRAWLMDSVLNNNSPSQIFNRLLGNEN